MEYFYIQEITFIHFLQETFERCTDEILVLQYVTNPRILFLLIFIVVFLWDQSIGIRLFLVTMASEWANSILKWILHGQRPYWWVREYHSSGQSLFDRILHGQSLPEIRQYILTCETSPGNPSGHAMVSASAIYALTILVFQPLLNQLFVDRDDHISRLTWIAFGAYMTMVGILRCFLAAHFPHQVILGTFFGIVVAKLTLELIDSEELHLKDYLVLSVCSLSIGMGLFFVLYVLGIDPMWSVKIAKKNCDRPEWVHLDTTVFSSIIHVFSMILGLGLGLHFQLNTVDQPKDLLRFVFSFCFAICIAVGYHHAAIPKESLVLFYLLWILKNCLSMYLFVALTPKLGCVLSNFVRIKVKPL